tara:strand:+ start:712 stop:1020 length:309 start_codon:yes stop_codon:yes gene_type:complete
MAYIDPYKGKKKGVLAKFTFKGVVGDRDWDFDRESKDVNTFYNDEYAVGFEGDLDYEYNVERFDETEMEGNAWVWISTDADVDALKAHSSFIGTSLLRDIRS